MDPKLYKAIQNDNHLHFQQTTNLGFLQQITTTNILLETQLTPNKNTTLHIAALFGSTKSAKEILKSSPSLVLRVNNKGQTPLHIAAVEGHYNIAHALIEQARAVTVELESGISTSKHMVRMRNEDGDTALHEAVRYEHLHVVKLLLEEDSEFFYLPNKAEETPLYIAAEEGFRESVYEILETCDSPSYSGPAGRTALHAAVIFDYQGMFRWEKLL